MPNIVYMRCYIAGRGNDAWRKKVANMPNRQVIAIYHKMTEEGTTPRMRETSTSGYEQLSFFEGKWSTEIKEEYLK